MFFREAIHKSKVGKAFRAFGPPLKVAIMISDADGNGVVVNEKYEEKRKYLPKDLELYTDWIPFMEGE